MTKIKRVLVTGNLGYIGSVLTPMLVEQGFEVTGVDSGFFIGKSFVTQKAGEYRQMLRDVRDLHVLELKGYDAIIHLAGLSNDPLGELDPKLTDDINHKATVRLAKLAKEAGVRRFVFSSSCSAYGLAGDKPVDESAGFAPQSAYAKSKIDAETGLRALADKDFCVVLLRNATVYGVSPRQRFDLVVNNLSGAAHTTGKITLLSDGSPWRPIIHIEDVSSAFIQALKADEAKVSNQAFNVGIQSENYTVLQIAQEVQKQYPHAALEVLGKPGGDTRSYQVDFSKARDVLGFKGSWNLAKGCEELRSTLAKVDLTPELFNDEFFVTLKRMKNLTSQDLVGPDLRWNKEPWGLK